jgi:hypothetical protein
MILLLKSREEEVNGIARKVQLLRRRGGSRTTKKRTIGKSEASQER